MRMPETERAARRVQALEERLVAARKDRDAAVRDRRAEGIGPTQIAQEVGLTRQAVYNILTEPPDNVVDITS